MTADAESILEIADRWLSEGRRLAWATVVSTWSSSPRPLGSQLLIGDDGRFAGSVSGGCVEAAVIQAAAELLAGGPPQALQYGVSTEQAWDVGLPCGGKIEVFLAQAPQPLLKRLVEAQRTRVSIVYLTDLATGEQELWEPGKGNRIVPEPEPLGQAVLRAVQEELSQLVEADGRRVFVQVVAAPLRLVVVGAVHLTQALAGLAELAGFELIVVDPRTAFGTPERFPRATLIHDWPDVALAQLQPDRRTAVVVLSHDAKLDEPALVAALRSECFYIGALGSRRTQQSRRRRLAEEGFSETELARIHGPVGLDIGALTTPEMAISIMAELIQARRRPAERNGPASGLRSAELPAANR
jgi:xanthine dehydrogenase accessory factor